VEGHKCEASKVWGQECEATTVAEDVGLYYRNMGLYCR